MRRSEDFRRTVRRGVRAGRRTVVVHALRAEPSQSATGASRADDGRATPTSGSLVGFVVTKAVGTAVRRNRVRRRLRHLAMSRVAELGDGTLVVVRALPPAADPDADLDRDLDSAWSAALAKLRVR